jgi:glycosyltransferase involved in cell wall biosynthesis
VKLHRELRVSIVSTYPPEQCGIATYTQYLTDALDQTAHALSVRVVTPSAVGVCKGGRVTPYEVPDSDYTSGLIEAVLSTEPDVVHFQHEFGIFGADQRFLDVLVTLKQAHVPLIVTMHTIHTDLSVDMGCGWFRGFSLAGINIEAYQREIGRLADMIVVHHDGTMRQALIRQGVDRDVIRTVAHGTVCTPLELVLPVSHPLDGADPLIVAPGYLRKSKNFGTVMQAFAGVLESRPSAHLWMGGFAQQATGAQDGGLLESHLEMVRALGIEDAVTLQTAPPSEAELTRLLRLADVVLCVYDEDSRSVSGIFHRAIGAGAIVVASRRPKFQELADVCDELLVDPGRPVELARLIGRIFDDAPFRSVLRQMLSDLAHRTSWPTVASSHAELYHLVANSVHDSRISENYATLGPPFRGSAPAQMS